MRRSAFRAAVAALIPLCAVAARLSGQSVLVEAKTTAGDEVATLRTDGMRLLVPLHAASTAVPALPDASR